MADSKVKYFHEGLGTFLLVLFGPGSAVADAVSGGAVGHLGVSLSCGLVVMAAILAFGNTSGAHINPAVSIALWTAGKFESKLLLGYLSFQFVGAVSASFLTKFLFVDAPHLGVTLPTGGVVQAFVMEAILSFVLMYVILKVTSDEKLNETTVAASIGAMVFLGVLIGGAVSGGSMNPVRSLAPALVQGNLDGLWIYLTAPFVGMVAAVGAKKIIN